MNEISLASGVNAVPGNVVYGSGMSFVDYNGDFYDDLSIGTVDSILFYRNNGNGTFSKDNNFNNIYFGSTKQIIWIDLDNDNDLDLFYLADNHIHIYKRISPTSLVNAKTGSGLSNIAKNYSGASFGDIDKDGDLDVYISIRDGHSSVLYRNLGNFTFLDISVVAGLPSSNSLDFCSAFFDYNNDNDLDIFVAVDKSATNKLFANLGNGIFTDSSAYLNMNISIDAMNTGIGDFNNDGYFDVYVTNTQNHPEAHVLHLNNGGIYFPNIATQSGLALPLQTGWGAAWVDVDNDKYLDIYVTSESNSSTQRNRLFKNNQNETFTEFMPFGLPNDTLESYSVVIGDYNNDGKSDIAVSPGKMNQMKLWKNNFPNKNYVKLLLKGTASNKFAVGSKISIFDGDSSQYRFTHCGINYLGQNSLQELFGMGSNEKIDSLIILWPSGLTSKYYNLGVNQNFLVNENECLNHQYIGQNTAANKYVGTNGNLFQASNWSNNVLPNLSTDIEINAMTPFTLTIPNDSTMNCRSLKLSGQINLINNGVLNINSSYGTGLEIGIGATFTNLSTINISKTCGRSVIVNGVLNQKGILNSSKL
jgi:hypothetical protein